MNNSSKSSQLLNKRSFRFRSRGQNKIYLIYMIDTENSYWNLFVTLKQNSKS